MLKRYALPQATVLRQLESELLHHHLTGNGVSGESLLAFYRVCRDPYGAAACRRLRVVNDRQHKAGAVAVLAKLLHRNASYRAIEVCRQTAADRVGAGLPGESASLQQVLPSGVSLFDAPVVAASRGLLQCFHRELDDLLTRTGWGCGNCTVATEGALYGLFRLSSRVQQLADFQAGTMHSKCQVRCAWLLQTVSARVLRHRENTAVHSLSLTLRLALVLQWLLGEHDVDSAESLLDAAQMKLQRLEVMLRQAFALQASATQTFADSAEAEQQHCLTVIDELVHADSVAHVSGQACIAACKLCLNYHALGCLPAYRLTDSLRVVLFLALQQHYRVSDHARRLLGRVTQLLSGAGSIDDTAMNTVAAELMLLEAELVCRLWRVTRHGVGWQADDALDGAREPASGHYKSLPDQLAIGLKHLPAAGTHLATVAGRVDEQWCQTVIAELKLLATGARRLKVYRIAALASVMLAVYQRLVETNQWRWKSTERSLLQRAHHRLKRMLDQAAAWQEVTAAHNVIRQLYGWLEGSAGDSDTNPNIDDSCDAIEQSRRLNWQIRAGLKMWTRTACRGEDATAELVLLLELLQGQDELMLNWQKRRSQT